MANLIPHLECHMTRRISSKEKEENKLIMYDSCLLRPQNIFKT
jgi:hypothetical protein